MKYSMYAKKNEPKYKKNNKYNPLLWEMNEQGYKVCPNGYVLNQYVNEKYNEDGKYLRIMQLYENARAFMREHGNPGQWGTTYPPQNMIETDIRFGNLYVCIEKDTIEAVFFYKDGIDPTYLKIYDGQWKNDAPYGVVHRITSSGKVKGAASFCLDWAFSQCGNLKIDTHENNIVMQNMLKKNGFTYCGRIYIDNGGERLAFQKDSPVP